MSKSCPIYGKAIYLDCKECIGRYCMLPYKTIVIGIDQSYHRTGISISADGNLLRVKSVNLEHYKTNSQKRARLRKVLKMVSKSVSSKGIEIVS